MRSSVDFPEPLVPRIATISPGAAERSIPASAGAPSNRLWSALISSIAVTVAEGILPGEHMAAELRQREIGQLAEDGEQQNARDDRRRPPGLLAVDQQKAEPLARTEHL